MIPCGSCFDFGNRIAVDILGNAYVTGTAISTDFPTENALQPALNGFSDAFVAKLNQDGSQLVYSTYLGGSSTDNGNDIAVDIRGNNYVMGSTLSTDFPTENALQPTFGGDADAFVAKIGNKIRHGEDDL